MQIIYLRIKNVNEKSLHILSVFVYSMKNNDKISLFYNLYLLLGVGATLLFVGILLTLIGMTLFFEGNLLRLGNVLNLNLFCLGKL